MSSSTGTSLLALTLLVVLLTASLSPALPAFRLVDNAPFAIQSVAFVLYLSRPAIAAVLLIAAWRRRDSVGPVITRVTAFSLCSVIVLSSYEIWVWWQTSRQ